MDRPLTGNLERAIARVFRGFSKRKPRIDIPSALLAATEMARRLRLNISQADVRGVAMKCARRNMGNGEQWMDIEGFTQAVKLMIRINEERGNMENREVQSDDETEEFVNPTKFAVMQGVFGNNVNQVERTENSNPHTNSSSFDKIHEKIESDEDDASTDFRYEIKHQKNHSEEEHKQDVQRKALQHKVKVCEESLQEIDDAISAQKNLFNQSRSMERQYDNDRTFEKMVAMKEECKLLDARMHHQEKLHKASMQLMKLNLHNSNENDITSVCGILKEEVETITEKFLALTEHVKKLEDKQADTLAQLKTSQVRERILLQLARHGEAVSRRLLDILAPRVERLKLIGIIKGAGFSPAAKFDIQMFNLLHNHTDDLEKKLHSIGESPMTQDEVCGVLGDKDEKKKRKKNPKKTTILSSSNQIVRRKEDNRNYTSNTDIGNAQRNQNDRKSTTKKKAAPHRTLQSDFTVANEISEIASAAPSKKVNGNCRTSTNGNCRTSTNGNDRRRKLSQTKREYERMSNMLKTFRDELEDDDLDQTVKR